MKRAVFFGPDVGLGQAKPFCTRSSWTPPPQHLPAELWDFFEKCGEDVGEVVKGIRDLTPNLTKEEIQALEDLAQRREIVIKPADRGGAIVIGLNTLRRG